MATHRAAVCHGKGVHFTVETRATPKPGPGELLLEVKSVALNPADHIMRALGVHITGYPTVTGFDVSGLVLEAGSDVPSDANHVNGSSFEPGVTRVAAYAAYPWRSSNADYGIFQQRCLIPWQHAVPLPETNFGWNEAATLPVAVEVALNALDVLQIPWPRPPDRDVDKKPRGRKNVLLVWGASASVGTMGVQIGRLLREDVESPFAAVYATAGAANLEYIKTLGADRAFDHKEPDVVDTIVAAANEDGLIIQHCFLAIGSVAHCQASLQAFVGDGDWPGRIASAAPLPDNVDQIDGVDTEFFMPPMDDETKRLAHFEDIGVWLKRNLEGQRIRPSPEYRVIGQGVEAIDAGLDTLEEGVSCTKLVVEIAK